MGLPRDLTGSRRCRRVVALCCGSGCQILGVAPCVASLPRLLSHLAGRARATVASSGGARVPTTSAWSAGRVVPGNQPRADANARAEGVERLEGKRGEAARAGGSCWIEGRRRSGALCLLSGDGGRYSARNPTMYLPTMICG